LAAGVNYYHCFSCRSGSVFIGSAASPAPAGTLGAIAVIVLSLVFVSKDLHSFWLKFQPMFAL